MDEAIEISVTVNGTVHRETVEPRMHAADFLRRVLGLTGTHVGCEQGVCGMCTVLLDGEAVKGCLLLAPQLDGHEVRTVESLAAAGLPSAEAILVLASSERSWLARDGTAGRSAGFPGAVRRFGSAVCCRVVRLFH